MNFQDMIQTILYKYNINLLYKINFDYEKIMDTFKRLKK